MIQNAGQTGNGGGGNSIARSLRERRRKRTYSDYVSDDSAVEADLDSGSDSEFTRSSPVGPTKAKRSKSDVARNGGAAGEVGSKTDCCYGVVGDVESFARDGEKLLMRQWLQRQADQGTIPGLCWIDDKRTQIRIPWKHGSRTGWTIDDCRVYRAWATHTGKIACITEPKKWKANFRCALNSLPDVRELTQLCQKKGTDPFKVYQMMPEVPRKSLAKKTKRCKAEKIDDDDEIDDFHESRIAVEAIKIKEEAPVSICNENPTFGHSSFSLLNGNANNIKKEEPDSDMPYSQSLIPTVVEEFSEQGTSESAAVLTNLRSVSQSTSEMSQMTLQSNSPSGFSSSSMSLDSSVLSLSDSGGEFYIDDFLLSDLFDGKFELLSGVTDLDFLTDGNREFFATSFT